MFDAIMWLLGFRVWFTDEAMCLKVPRWYLWLDRDASTLASRLRADMREHPEDWR